MNQAVTFSVDLEDHRADRSTPARYPAMTLKILDFIEELGVRGTFFVLGEVAEENPGLVREVSRRGHEIGFHSFDHLPLTLDNEARFRELTGKGKALLEDITGKPCIGFRAPVFSLTPDSVWTVEVLKAAGFAYSSSILPARHPLYGFPGAPHEPFKWHNGLIELPVPLAKFGPLSVPYLGGIYLRYLPLWMIAKMRRQASEHQLLWTYCHPYDFDTGEKFSHMRDASFWVSALLWLNREGSFGKLASVLKSGSAKPFAERFADGEFDDLPNFSPEILHDG